MKKILTIILSIVFMSSVYASVSGTNQFKYKIPQPDLITNDWDGDGDPNLTDPDDDNDGIPDTEDSIPFGKPDGGITTSHDSVTIVGPITASHNQSHVGYLTDGNLNYGSYSNTWNSRNEGNTGSSCTDPTEISSFLIFDRGTVEVLNTVKLTSTVGYDIHSVKSFSVLASNDNSIYTPIKSFVDIGADLYNNPGQLIDFTFTNTTAYKYYKFEFESGGNCLLIPEIEVANVTASPGIVNGNFVWGGSGASDPAYIRVITPDSVYQVTGSENSITGMPPGLQFDFVGNSGGYFFLLFDQPDTFIDNLQSITIDGEVLNTSAGSYTTWYDYGYGYVWGAHNFNGMPNFISGGTSSISLD
jgi:hypothetical protein